MRRNQLNIYKSQEGIFLIIITLYLAMYVHNSNNSIAYVIATAMLVPFLLCAILPSLATAQDYMP